MLYRKKIIGRKPHEAITFIEIVRHFKSFARFVRYIFGSASLTNANKL